MKIATFNVNSIRTRLQHVLDWLDREPIDVVCLQETKVVDQDFPGLEFQTRGYELVFHGQKTYNGVALISKKPITNIKTELPGDADDKEARFLCADIDGVRVIDVYVPNGREVDSPNYEHKLKWLTRLRQFLDDHCNPKDPLVLCGDFNVAPEDKDVYDPKRWHEKNLCSTPEREAITNLTNWGLRDSLRVYNQDPEVYSWWDYRQGMFGRNQGLRIDHLFVTNPVVIGLNSVEVRVELRRLEKPSDHTPVILDFELS